MNMREKILASTKDFRPQAIEVSELGGTVYIRPLTLAGLSKFQQILAKEPLRGPAVMILDCLCDETGTRLFSSDDEAAILEMPSAIAQKLIEAISKSSGLDEKSAGAPAGN